MRKVKWSIEIVKLVIVIVFVGIFILGYFRISNKNYTSALSGMIAAGGVWIVFQGTRIIGFMKDPTKYKKEQIELKDERTNLILINSSSSAYGMETFIITAITFYAIYRADVGFVLAIFTLWVFRIIFFFYYLSKNSKNF